MFTALNLIAVLWFRYLLRLLLSCFFYFISIHTTWSQVDTTYIRMYEGDITARFLFARKYTNFNLRVRSEDLTLRYAPSNGFNMGIGANYKWATVNLSYGFGFLNPYSNRGDTRAIDFQLHGYGQKLTLDFLAQFYTGFYLPKDRITSVDGGFYTRGDLEVRAVGGTLQYVFNNKKFSYRAAFIQNELQRKSAGSLLVGMEVYAGSVAGDSSILPLPIAGSLQLGAMNDMRFIEIGPNVGYAYTWVFKENFYITGTATISLNAGFIQYKEDEMNRSTVGINPNTLFRLSTGYAVKQWGFNVGFITTGIYLSSELDNHIIVNSGNIRFSINYRFTPSRKVKRLLKPVDEVKEQLDSVF